MKKGREQCRVLHPEWAVPIHQYSVGAGYEIASWYCWKMASGVWLSIVNGLHYEAVIRAVSILQGLLSLLIQHMCAYMIWFWLCLVELSWGISQADETILFHLISFRNIVSIVCCLLITLAQLCFYGTESPIIHWQMLFQQLCSNLDSCVVWHPLLRWLLEGKVQTVGSFWV